MHSIAHFVVMFIVRRPPDARSAVVTPVVWRSSAACTTAVAHQPSACKGRTIAGQKVCHMGLFARQKQGKGRGLSARWHTEKARREEGIQSGI